MKSPKRMGKVVASIFGVFEDIDSFKEHPFLVNKDDSLMESIIAKGYKTER